METIDDRFRTISTLFAEPLPRARLQREILDLIDAIIEDRKQSLGYWEKSHIGSAISALSMNLNRNDPSYKTWLSLCMVNLDKALVPPSQRNDSYSPHYQDVERITYRQLLEATDHLRRHVDDP